MKIYGDYSFLLDKLNVWNSSQVKVSQNGTKIVEFADKFIEEQRAVSKDEMTISREGIEYMREQLSDLGAGIKPGAEEGRSLSLITGRDMSLMDGYCATYITMRLDTIDGKGVSSNLYRELSYRYGNEMAGKEDQDWSVHMKGLTDAYIAAYKKIAEGYEDGTREVWVRDYSTGEDFNGVEIEMDGEAVRYRKLTKEEELDYLDKSMDKLIGDAAMQYAKEAAARKKAEAEGESGTSAEDWGEIAKSLVRETKIFLDKIKQKIEEILKKLSEKEVDIAGRMEVEAQNYRAETVERGKQQRQCENYRKMSQMVSDVQTLLGNIRA